MNCPKCGKPLRHQRRHESGLAVACESCGWGCESRQRDEEEHEEGGVRLGLPLAIGLSLAIALGPYLLGRTAIALLGAQDPMLEPAAERLRDLLNLHYGWLFLAYVAVAAFVSPAYDPENLGLFGFRRIDNPLTLEDDRNRAMRKLAIFLWPGKLVWTTVRHVWRGRSADETAR